MWFAVSSWNLPLFVLQVSEITTFEVDSKSMLIDNIHLGDTSSCLDDIGNDNFQVLRIDEEDLSSEHGSIDSISNILERVDVV